MYSNMSSKQTKKQAFNVGADLTDLPADIVGQHVDHHQLGRAELLLHLRTHHEQAAAGHSPPVRRPPFRRGRHPHDGWQLRDCGRNVAQQGAEPFFYPDSYPSPPRTTRHPTYLT